MNSRSRIETSSSANYQTSKAEKQPDSADSGHVTRPAPERRGNTAQAHLGRLAFYVPHCPARRKIHCRINWRIANKSASAISGPPQIATLPRRRQTPPLAAFSRLSSIAPACC